MTEYVCSNCAELSREEGYSVPYIVTACESEKCNYEPYVNTDYVEALRELKDKSAFLDFSAAFKERYFSADN